MFRKLDPNKSGVVNLNNMKKFYCTKKHPKVVSGNTDYCFSLYMLYALYYDNSVSALVYIYSVAVDQFNLYSSAFKES